MIAGELCSLYSCAFKVLCTEQMCVFQEFLQDDVKKELSIKKEDVKPGAVNGGSAATNTKDTNSTSSSKGGRIGGTGRKSIDEKSRWRRHRRSVAKSRLGDVFDLQPMIRRVIGFKALGLGGDAPPPPVPRSVGRPPKKHKSCSTMPRPKICVPLSEYRGICLKLTPYGKRSLKSRPAHDFSVSHYFT